MAVTGKLYGKAPLSWLNREVEWDADTWKCMLTTSSYTPDQDTHDYKDDVTNEVTGTGYTATGATLANKTITYTGATNKVMLDCDDVSWSTSTITARTAVFYDASPASDATRPLLCYQQSDADIVSTAGTFSVAIHASGLVELTIS